LNTLVNFQRALHAFDGQFSVCNNSLDEPAGLEHEAFARRARHFARRLSQAAGQAAENQRSPLIDRLFGGETEERVTRMQEALVALPPDAVRLMPFLDQASTRRQSADSAVARQAKSTK